jgi:hypothetical protein
MTFEEALKILGIEDYADQIFKSNSHGELFHLVDYVRIAEVYLTVNINRPGTFESIAGSFRPMFIAIIEAAGKQWDRPESIYQHIPRAMSEYIAAYR